MKFFLVVEKKCQKKFMVGKKIVRNFFCRTFFWSEKNLGLKQKIWSINIFDLKKNLLVVNFFGQKAKAGIYGVRKSILHFFFMSDKRSMI